MFPTSLTFAAAAFSHGNYDHHGSGMMWGEGWAGMGFGLIIMIVVIAAIVALVVLLVRWLGGQGRADQSAHLGPRGQTPMEILKERYARGEIDKEEFEERRRTLGD